MIRAGSKVRVRGEAQILGGQPPEVATVVCYYRAYPQDLMVQFADGVMERVPRNACEEVLDNAS